MARKTQPDPMQAFDLLMRHLEMVHSQVYGSDSEGLREIQHAAQTVRETLDVLLMKSQQLDDLATQMHTLGDRSFGLLQQHRDELNALRRAIANLDARLLRMEQTHG